MNKGVLTNEIYKVNVGKGKIEYSIVYTLHGQLIRTIGAAILASTALTSSGRERLSLYPYSGRPSRDMQTQTKKFETM
ncbi:hypothetical protein EVAR_71657_1 [Eumeta japonica]|uniref:Uncharacterized protein n=1 Tax=Eumeta variegata TaxID=151549 RepID=A0A4C1T212_EUMVA|nr:hypothetical protein EVAR_71657_1 [Eumeta japonica]